MLRSFRLASVSRCYLTEMSHFSQLNSSRPSLHVKKSCEFPSLLDYIQAYMKRKKLALSLSVCQKKTAESECLKNSSKILLLYLLEETQAYFNEQKWKLAYSGYAKLIYNFKHRHELKGNLAVCALQLNSVYSATSYAYSAAELHPGQMVYHELLVQALIRQNSYREALEKCNTALEIGSKILEANDPDVEELSKLKQHCTDKMYAGWEGDITKDDDYPFRQHLQGFIPRDALEEIAASAYIPCHCSLCTKERQTKHRS